MKHGVLFLVGMGILALGMVPRAYSQGAAAPPAGAVESRPLPPPPGGPPSGAGGSGGVTLTQEPAAPGAPTPAAPGASPPGAGARSTLVPDRGDPLDVKEVTLTARAAAITSGSSSWDEGFGSLKNGIRKLEEELARAGVRASGRPVTVFLETDDAGFRYDMLVPVEEQAVRGRATLTPEIRVGRTPEGKAYHFVHKGPYEEIDSTYETITAYLDSRGILPKDAFIEEYVTDLTESTDENLEINIFVQPR